MDNSAPTAPTPSTPMTKEELEQVVQQILKSERGECPPPDADTLHRAYDAIRVNRAAVSSRRAAGPAGAKTVPLPVDLNELF